MITPITATFPALNFPKESDYPTQNDWAAFSAAAELNYGILSGTWSDKSEEFKAQTNTLAQQIQNIGENAINAITFDNIAQLKLNSNIGRIDVLGYYTKGDGGGGTFYWDSTSTEADNGGTIIQATGITTGRWKRPKSSVINVKQFGAKGDGIADDWYSIQISIVYAKNNGLSVYIPDGKYIISKTIFATASNMQLATTSINGENLQLSHDPDGINIFGESMTKTIIKYIGTYHALQIGEFGDSSYGLATKATWHGSIKNMKITSDNGLYSLVMSWGHHYKFDNLYITGGSKSTVEYFSSTTSLSLWNKMESCKITGGGERNFVMRGNSNLLIDTFVGYASLATLRIEGARNNVTRLSVENTNNSGLTPYFVECYGGCSFYDPEFETGEGGTLHGFHFKTENEVIIQNPTIVGIVGSRYIVDETVLKPRIMLIGAETQHDLAGNEQTIKALGNTNGISPTILMPNVRVLPKQKAVTRTIPIGAAPNWGAFTSIISGDTYNGYGSGIVINGIKLSNTQTSGTITQPDVQWRLYDASGFSTMKTIQGPAQGSPAKYFGQYDMDFTMFRTDSKYTRNVTAASRASVSGTIDITLYYTEI